MSSDDEKTLAITKVARDRPVVPEGRAKWRIGGAVVHVRYCSPNPAVANRYKFNINPNTLSADYELWVCGSADTRYLMPISFLQGIYDRPDTYVDRTHPEIRVVSVDVDVHTVTFAAGGQGASLRPYHHAVLP